MLNVMEKECRRERESEKARKLVLVRGYIELSKESVMVVDGRQKTEEHVHFFKKVS